LKRISMDPNLMKFLEEDEVRRLLPPKLFTYTFRIDSCSVEFDETLHSGADVEAFTAELNRDIEGNNSTSHQLSDSNT
ncbi:hypothetical protein MIMGU_mgv11b023615mg, partial [Erythranthe guttata]